MPYQESKKYQRQLKQGGKTQHPEVDVPNRQEALLQYIKNETIANDVTSVIDGIDKFCQQNWMMNLGPEKGDIVDIYTKQRDIKKIIEIGGYCGYSAIRFARANPNAKILSIQVSQRFAKIAHEIQKHAGVAEQIFIHLGSIGESEEAIKKHGLFDMVFIDHIKHLYLQDFQLLEKYGVIQKGTLVVADNIITSGAPEYLAALKKNENYNSILEHTFLQYCDVPDAVLFSQRITK